MKGFRLFFALLNTICSKKNQKNSNQKKYIMQVRQSFSVRLLILIRKMTMNKYRIISLEPLQLHIQRMSIKKLPEIRPRTLSLRCPTPNIQIASKISNIPVATYQKKTVREMSALNLKQRPQLVSSNKTKRSQLIGFDNRIFCNERSKSVKKAQQLPGLSRHDLVQRRQSHLNTYFNIRKNKLKEITKENKKIYERINSQKSLYSSRQLNKSTDSMNGSRLSKHSSRGSISSSRNTQKSKANLHKIPLKKKQIEIKIESKDINKLQNSQVNRYMNIFCNHLNQNIKAYDKAKTAKNHTMKGKQNGERVALGLSKILQQMDQRREVKKNLVFGRIL